MVFFCNQKGQGLIETMITIVIIGIALIALMRFQNYLAYSNSLTTEQNEATMLAESQLEKLHDYIFISKYSPSYDDIGAETFTVNGKTATYTIQQTLRNEMRYKAVNLTVTWPDLYGNSQSVELSTHIARRENWCAICFLSNFCLSDPNSTTYCKSGY